MLTGGQVHLTPVDGPHVYGLVLMNGAANIRQAESGSRSGLCEMNVIRRYSSRVRHVVSVFSMHIRQSAARFLRHKTT
jgi:hypothetical protein